MEKLGKLFKIVFTLFVAVAMTQVSYAQCAKFNDSANGDEALKAHSVYRTYLSSIKKVDDLKKLRCDSMKSSSYI